MATAVACSIAPVMGVKGQNVCVCVRVCVCVCVCVPYVAVLNTVDHGRFSI